MFVGSHVAFVHFEPSNTSNNLIQFNLLKDGYATLSHNFYFIAG